MLVRERKWSLETHFGDVGGTVNGTKRGLTTVWSRFRMPAWEGESIWSCVGGGGGVRSGGEKGTIFDLVISLLL